MSCIELLVGGFVVVVFASAATTAAAAADDDHHHHHHHQPFCVGRGGGDYDIYYHDYSSILVCLFIRLNTHFLRKLLIG